MRKFNFDSTGASFAILILTPGFLMMAIAFIGFESTTQLIFAVAIGLIVLGGIWLALAKGTYVLIDKERNLYRTSGFFFSKSIPLSNIVSIGTQGMFVGLMTKIILKYRDQDGENKVMGTMTKQSFKKGEFKEFIETLRSSVPNIEIPQELS